MSTDYTPLEKKLTSAQVDSLLPFMKSAKGDQAKAGLKLCEEWGIETSRTAVHTFYKRRYFGWCLERAAWVAKQTENMPEFDQEFRQLTMQKLFAEMADTECDPKFMIMARSLQIEQDKLNLATRSAETRFKLETGKLSLADRRVKLLEAKMQKASAKLKELRDPKNADDAATRKAILDRVDELMGIKKT